MDCNTRGFPVHKLLELMQTHVLQVSDAIQPFHPLSSPFPLTFNESVLHIRWPKYWSFSFSINPSNKYSGLISFRMDWLDLLAVQGTLKSLLQHHSLKASIIWHSAFFIAQLTSIHGYWKNYSFDYMDLCRQSSISFFLFCSFPTHTPGTNLDKPLAVFRNFKVNLLLGWYTLFCFALNVYHILSRCFYFSL